MGRPFTIVFLTALLTLQSVVALGAPPSNDDFDQRKLVGALPFSESVLTTEATPGAGDPIFSCGPANARTVWYQYTATYSGPLVSDTYGSQFDTLLAIYTDGPTGLTELACNDDTGSRHSKLEIEVSNGVNYYFQVGGWGIASGNLTLNVVAPYLPTNDNFEDAISVGSFPYEYADDNKNAGMEDGEPTGCFDLAKTVWFKYMPTSRHALGGVASGTKFTAVFNVFSGTSWDSLTHLACSGLNGVKSLTVVPGTTYYFQVGAHSSAGFADNISFVLSAPAAPGNDNFDQAALVSSFPFSLQGSTTGATIEEGEPISPCGEGIDHTVWFQFTPSQDMALRIDTIGSAFQAILAVYTGDDLGNLSRVTCHDGFFGGPRVDFYATGGVDYLIQIGGWFGANGTLEFNVSDTVIPANDNFNDAIDLDDPPFTVNTTNEGANLEEGEPTPSCVGKINRSIWFKYTPPIDGTIHADTIGSKISNVMTVYTGNSLNDLTELACTALTGYPYPIDFQVTGGKTYFIQLSGWAGYPGKLTMNFNIHWYTRTESKAFQLATAEELCSTPGGSRTDLCFRIQPGDASLTIRVEDLSERRVNAFWTLYDASGNFMDFDWLCETASIVPLPSDAASIAISINKNFTGTPCRFTQGEGVATSGTVFVDFK